MARAKITYKDKDGKIRKQRQRAVVVLNNESPSWYASESWDTPKFHKLVELLEIAGLASQQKPLAILGAPAFNAADDLNEILTEPWIERTPGADILATMRKMLSLEGNELRQAIRGVDDFTYIEGLDVAARKYWESLAGKDAKLPTEWYSIVGSSCLSDLIQFGISDDELHEIIGLAIRRHRKGKGKRDMSYKDDIMMAKLMNWWRTYTGKEPEIKSKSRFIRFCEMILSPRVGIQMYPERVVEIVRHAKKSIAEDPQLFSLLFPTVEPFKP